MTKTEALVKINSLKSKHEALKKDIIDLAITMQEKEKELALVEEQYVIHLEILVEEEK